MGVILTAETAADEGGAFSDSGNTRPVFGISPIRSASSLSPAPIEPGGRAGHEGQAAIIVWRAYSAGVAGSAAPVKVKKISVPK